MFQYLKQLLVVRLNFETLDTKHWCIGRVDARLLYTPSANCDFFFTFLESENELVALIPVRDKRLKPSKT